MSPAMDSMSMGYSKRSMESSVSMAADSEVASPAQQPRQWGGMFKVPSLVFDIEVDEEGHRRTVTGEEETPLRELRRWLLPADAQEHKLRNDVALALEAHKSQGSPLEANTYLATRLSRLGYRVHIRTALGGGEGFECLRNLRHVFLTVTSMPGAGMRATSQTFVVDLTFKEQFSIAKPTERYKQLLAALPTVYVAPEATVAPLVNFLCQEIAAAFRANGAVLPPWRHASSMLSKWLPRKSLDENVSEAYTVPTPRTGAAQQGLHQQGQGQQGAPLPAMVAAAVAAPIAAAAGAHAPRRSLDGPVSGYPPAHPIRSHWAASGMAQQQAIMAQLQPGSRAQMQQQQTQTHQLQPADIPHLPYARLHVRATTKPISCEPMNRVVGGNFIAVGNA